MRMNKETFRILYYISLGAWIMGGIVTLVYGRSTPMWIALIFMNIFNFAKK